MPNMKKFPDVQDILLQDNLVLFWEHGNKGWALRIHQDDEPQNPRTEYDNITTMACFHRRHPMGDKLDQETPGEFWDSLLREHVDNGRLLALCQAGKIPGLGEFMEDEGLKRDDPDGILDAVHDAVESGGRIDFAMAALQDEIMWLPMWLYEHSGMTVSCGEREYPYNDQFDSSAIGWCLLDKKRALSELMTDEKHWKEAAEKAIRAEVETYDMFLQGDCWYYDLMSCRGCPGYVENIGYPDGRAGSDESAWDESDSCGGFMGSYLEQSGILDAVGHGLDEAVRSGKYDTGTAEPHTVTTWTLVRNASR